MTERQAKKMYWPLWNAACRANGWRVRRGCTLNAEPLPTQSDWVNTVLSMAARIAASKHQSATLDDIRYAAHYVATGKACSSSDLTNKELSRVFILFRLLADHEDLEAINEWNHPELEDRRRLLAVVSQAPQAIVIAICRNGFDATDPERLDNHQLRTLVIALRNRADRERRPFAVARETEMAGNPF